MGEEIVEVSRKEQRDAIPRGVLVYQEPNKSQEKLAKQAQRVLGYGGLLTFTAGGRLQAVLENLGIEILDPSAVFEYQSKYGNAELSEPVRFYDSESDDDDDDEDEEEEDDRPRAKKKVKSAGRQNSSWNRVGIAEYVKAIPEFVVRKAIQIKEALPQVQIFVEELRRDPDPFLVICFEGENYFEEYYVEVWEEPKFEGRFTNLSKER